MFSEVTLYIHLLGNILYYNNRQMNTYFSHGYVFKFSREREHPEQFDLAESGLQELVVGRDGLVCQVVVAGDTSQLRHLKWIKNKI